MKIVVFGLSVSSAWGNGHATLLRGLFRALHELRHEVHFFERDAPYYAAHRDAAALPYTSLHIYGDWTLNLSPAKKELADADVGIVTSYCPDGIAASELVLESNLPRTVFYDMDTPVTFMRLAKGDLVEYLPSDGLHAFDLVLSYTGGRALDLLQEKLGARRVAPLYGWVDPAIHHPVQTDPRFEADLSYLGTYAADRESALNELLLAPAGAARERKFLIAGAMYPNPSEWPANVRHLSHVSPPEHAAFYSSSSLTLNVTRGSMASMGYCPSGRLFEAAACGTPVLSDWWEGLDYFFEPNEEILIAQTRTQAVEQITREAGFLRLVGERARERTLDCHTAAIRARQLIELLEDPPSEDRHAMGGEHVLEGT